MKILLSQSRYLLPWLAEKVVNRSQVVDSSYQGCSIEVPFLSMTKSLDGNAASPEPVKL